MNIFLLIGTIFFFLLFTYLKKKRKQSYSYAKDLLDDLSSKDPGRVWSASCAILKNNDKHVLSYLSKHVDSIKSATFNVDLGGGLYPNSEHLKSAITKLQYVKNGSPCLCNLYEIDIWYDHEKEQKNGKVKIIEAVESQGWPDYFICQCKMCKQKYKAKFCNGHFDFYKWKKT